MNYFLPKLLCLSIDLICNQRIWDIFLVASLQKETIKLTHGCVTVIVVQVKLDEKVAVLTDEKHLFHLGSCETFKLNLK